MQPELFFILHNFSISAEIEKNGTRTGRLEGWVAAPRQNYLKRRDRPVAFCGFMNYRK